MGDTQYNCGGLSAFNQAYHPTWGQHKAMTHPILSDEDYDTSGTGCGAAGADGYFAYWGAQAGPQPGGYYSFDVGSWHIVALNSECSDVPGGCDEGSPQNNWLEQDLERQRRAVHDRDAAQAAVRVEGEQLSDQCGDVAVLG